MRIVIDIDGTISATKKPGQTYENVTINPGAVEKIRALKAAGHYIILQTARHMKTTGGDVKKVIEKVGATTEDWLKLHNIPYDEIHFGKPYNQVLIDDRAYVFEGWDNIRPEDFDSQRVNILITLPKNYNPLAKVKGKTAVEWAIKSFENIMVKGNFQLIFAVYEQQIKNNQLDGELKKIFGEKIKIISIPSLANNQLEVAVCAQEYINNFQQLIISSGDRFSSAPPIEGIEEENLEGLLTVEENNKVAEYYIKNDEWGFVEEISAKPSALNLVPAGLYFFNNGRDFLSCARIALFRKEHSITDCYNELVKRGQKVKAINSAENWELNSPETLKIFEEKFKYGN